MKRKKIVLLALITLFLVGYVAGEDNSTATNGETYNFNPGWTTPDSVVWNLERFMDRIRLSIAREPAQKANVRMGIAEKRLGEIYVMTEENRTDNIERSLKSYESNMKKLNGEIESSESEQKINLATKHNDKAQALSEYLNSRLSSFSNDEQANIQKVLNSLEITQETLKIDNPENESEETTIEATETNTEENETDNNTNQQNKMEETDSIFSKDQKAEIEIYEDKSLIKINQTIEADTKNTNKILDNLDGVIRYDENIWDVKYTEKSGKYSNKELDSKKTNVNRNEESETTEIEIVEDYTTNKTVESELNDLLIDRSLQMHSTLQEELKNLEEDQEMADENENTGKIDENEKKDIEEDIELNESSDEEEIENVNESFIEEEFQSGLSESTDPDHIIEREVEEFPLVTLVVDPDTGTSTATVTDENTQEEFELNSDHPDEALEELSEVTGHDKLELEDSVQEVQILGEDRGNLP